MISSGRTMAPSIDSDLDSLCTGPYEFADHDSDDLWKPARRDYAIMGTVAIVSLMVAIDATIIIPALPTLANDLDGSTTDAYWSGTSYLLASAVSQPFLVGLSEIFGRQKIFSASILFFGIGTIICAPMAHNFAVFLSGRSLQGIGGGGIIAMGQVIYADLVPLRQRAKYFSMVLGAWAVGTVLGPLLGGLFVQHLSWKWCFYINLPFCVLGFFLVPNYVSVPAEQKSFGSKLYRVDWVGGILFVGGMTSFILGLSWAGIQFPWASVGTLAPILIGVLSITISLVWEHYWAREPFIRLSLFHSRSAIAAYACALCQGFLLFGCLYYIPFYFVAVRHTSPIQSGVNILPISCLLIPGSIFVAFLTSRTGRFRWAVWIGWVVTTVSCGLLLLFDESTNTATWAIILSIFGMGNGMVLTGVSVATQVFSPHGENPFAACMYAFLRSTGMAFGVALCGTTFQNMMAKKLTEFGLPENIALNAEAFVGQLRLMEPDDPIRIHTLSAYVYGFCGVFLLMTLTACSGLLVSLLMKHESMDRTKVSRFSKDNDDSCEALTHDHWAAGKC